MPTPPKPTASGLQLHTVAALFAILALTVVCYWPSLSGPFLFDDVLIERGTAAPQPSVCSVQAEVCDGEDFDPGVAGDLAQLGWVTFAGTNSLSGALWGTTDDGFCGTANGRPGNFTGGTGEAACIDSDAADAGATDAWLCTRAFDLQGVTAASLRLRYAYQPFGIAADDDAFAILAGTAAPGPATGAWRLGSTA